MGINLKGKLFKDVYPEGAAMLNPVLNPDVDIDTLSAGSVKRMRVPVPFESEAYFQKESM